MLKKDQYLSFFLTIVLLWGFVGCGKKNKIERLPFGSENRPSQSQAPSLSRCIKEYKKKLANKELIGTEFYSASDEQHFSWVQPTTESKYQLLSYGDNDFNRGSHIIAFSQENEGKDQKKLTYSILTDQLGHSGFISLNLFEKVSGVDRFILQGGFRFNGDCKLKAEQLLATEVTPSTKFNFNVFEVKKRKISNQKLDTDTITQTVNLEKDVFAGLPIRDFFQDEKSFDSYSFQGMAEHSYEFLGSKKLGNGQTQRAYRHQSRGGVLENINYFFSKEMELESLESKLITSVKPFKTIFVSKERWLEVEHIGSGFNFEKIDIRLWTNVDLRESDFNNEVVKFQIMNTRPLKFENLSSYFTIFNPIYPSEPGMFTYIGEKNMSHREALTQKLIDPIRTINVAYLTHTNLFAEESYYYDYSHPSIQKIRREIIGKNPLFLGLYQSEAAVLQQILLYIDNNYGYSCQMRDGTGMANMAYRASELVEMEEFVCGQYSMLFTALARSFGIATRVVYGFKFDEDGSGENSFGAHGWVEVWLDGRTWVPLEPQNKKLESVGLNYFPIEYRDETSPSMNIYSGYGFVEKR